MNRISRFGLWLRAWALLPIAAFLLFVVLLQCHRTYRILQNSPVTATVYRHSVTQGAIGTSFRLIIHYEHPQNGESFAWVLADSQRLQSLPPATPLTVCYAADNPRIALLSNEAVVDSAFVFSIFTIGALAYAGIIAQHQWQAIGHEKL
jgi:hypothetical protein